MLVDSHCHLDQLDLKTHNNNLDDVLAAAKNRDVKYFLCPGLDLIQSEKNLLLPRTYPEVKIAIGLHPTEQIDLEIKKDGILALANDPSVIAIGETGLDYYEHRAILSSEQKERQKRRFRAHIQAALEIQKPLIIHSRAAGIDTLQILKEEGASKVGGVFHCFTDEQAIAETAISMGFYIGITGIITFKNAISLQTIVTKLPIDKILLETDAPYLAPVPYRGKPNEPAYLFYIAEFVAKLRGVSYLELADITTENFFRLFKV
jgi:TatD DNase family protein